MTAPAPWRAVLVPDEGRRSRSAEFFRSAPHLRAEGTTHSLVLEGPAGVQAFLPLVVRPIAGTPFRDAVSPYGFPGARLAGQGGAVVPREAVDWRGVELVSIFVRERIGGPCLFTDATLRAEVFVIDPARPVQFRKSHRHHIRRNRELGYTTRCTRAPDASRAEREGFVSVYRQTMVRDAAQPRFFYSEAYFDEVFASPLAWLVSTFAPDGAVASAALNVVSDGLLHNYLGGTSDAHLHHSPAKNVIGGLVALGRELGLPVHLGGGIVPGDGIEYFKRGFANASSRYFTHELVCDARLYAALSEGHGPTSYFPVYRAAARPAAPHAEPAPGS